MATRSSCSPNCRVLNFPRYAHLPDRPERVGVFGLGTIGRKVASVLHRGGVPGLELCGVSTRTPAKAQVFLAELSGGPPSQSTVPIVTVDELARCADVLVDCAPAAAFRTITDAAIAHRKTLVTVSGAAMLESPELEKRARDSGSRIILATGALLGLDAMRAAAEGEIQSVRMVTRKPPRSLADAAWVRAQGIDLERLTAPMCLFRGTAREGAKLFPANVNVAAALGLAGVGPDRTQLEIWADPAFQRNTHTISVEADSARFEMTIENVPSEEHPGTGKITALSVIACLRSLVAPLKVGT
ncbi:MAG: aspartate dehydrogenase [Proteobacteria bacterium]|nr:aspartate dehydrogenase [Pseudomonadota bacterium]